MRILLLGDVGGVGGYHLGDEAMLDVAVTQLRKRGADQITVISGDPNDTSARYGVTSVGRIGFSDRSVGDDAPRDLRLEAVLALVDGPLESGVSAMDPGDQIALRRAEPVIEAVRQSDAVVITGGGNLSSSWPEHVYERVALLSIAHRVGVPAIVSSQTIGPDLTPRQATLLSAALRTVRLVGLREARSYDLSTRLLDDSTPRRLQLDDAADLPADAVRSFPGLERLRDGYIALSSNDLGGAEETPSHLDVLAALVHRLHHQSGLPIVFVPNLGSLRGQPEGDVAVGQALLQRVGSAASFVVAPLLPAREAAGLLRDALAIVSARYHPIVFGVASAVPCLAVAQDRYTAVKLEGALAHAGLGPWCVPLEMLDTPLANDVVDEFWTRRDELAEHLARATVHWPAQRAQHWDEVWAALTTTEPIPVEGPPPVRSAGPAPKVVGLASVTSIVARLRDRAAIAEAQIRDAESYAVDLEAALAISSGDLEVMRVALVEQEALLAAGSAGLEAVRQDAAAEIEAQQGRFSELVAVNAALLEEVAHVKRSAASALALVADLGGRLDARMLDLSRVSAALADATREAELVRVHLDAVLATRTFRWTRRLRNSYAWVRRRPL